MLQNGSHHGRTDRHGPLYLSPNDHASRMRVAYKVGNLDSLIPCSFVVIDCDRRTHRQTWTDKYNGYCPILRGA